MSDEQAVSEGIAFDMADDRLGSVPGGSVTGQRGRGVGQAEVVHKQQLADEGDCIPAGSDCPEGRFNDGSGRLLDDGNHGIPRDGDERDARWTGELRFRRSRQARLADSQIGQHWRPFRGICSAASRSGDQRRLTGDVQSASIHPPARGADGRQ
jgi:hypothetical protein